MKSVALILLCSLAFSLVASQAVEKNVGGSISFNSSVPTNADISNWTTGWSGAGVTGWDYVGTVNGASGVYLGNGWVLTAGHVGAGTFALSGTSYSYLAGSAQEIVNGDGSVADLTLFRLTLSPNLPSLSIDSSAPTAFSDSQSGSQVAMIGYGGSHGETWGLNTVTRIDLAVEVNSYISADFETAYGSNSAGNNSFTNNYLLVPGDSGGADFLYNSESSVWELAGINEAVDTTNNNSYYVQLGTYASQINTITEVPEPSPAALLILGLLGAAAKCRRLATPVPGVGL